MNNNYKVLNKKAIEGSEGNNIIKCNSSDNNCDLCDKGCNDRQCPSDGGTVLWGKSF